MEQEPTFNLLEEWCAAKGEEAPEAEGEHAEVLWRQGMQMAWAAVMQSAAADARVPDEDLWRMIKARELRRSLPSERTLPGLNPRPVAPQGRPCALSFFTACCARSLRPRRRSPPACRRRSLREREAPLTPLPRSLLPHYSGSPSSPTAGRRRL